MAARGCLPLLMMLIAITLSVNEVILNTYQTNVTSNTNNTIYLSSYDGSGTNLATGAGNIITFYTRDESGYWGNPYSRINISNTLTEARFRDDGAWVAVIDNTTNNIYLFNKAPSSMISTKPLIVVVAPNRSVGHTMVIFSSPASPMEM